MVQINGEQQDVALVAGKTLLAYVTEAGYDPVGIVIEKNMEIIHREDFDKVNIDDGDVIEILHFVQEVWLFISYVRAVNNRQRPTKITEF